MSRRITLKFKHPPCNVYVDVNLPLPDPITESTEAMAARVLSTCPICKEPMRYVGWSFGDPDDDDADDEEERISAEKDA